MPVSPPPVKGATGRDTLQLVLAAIFEGQTGARDQILDGL